MTRLKLLAVMMLTALLQLSAAGASGSESRPAVPSRLASATEAGRESAPSVGVDATAVPRYTYKIVNTYPHDPDAFTQGLLFDGEFLYESTGRYGKSTLRKVDLSTGKVLKSIALPASIFAEGLACRGGRLVQLTWRSAVGFVYDKDSFQKEREFSYPTEGWGITSDGDSFIMSDGTATLRFLDPETYAEKGALQVADRGAPVAFLNELEFVRGEIFANVWREDMIARISPETGRVVGWIDLGGLRKALGPVRSADALNGIAFDAARGRLFVTGKLWPVLFEIEILPAESK